MDKSKRDYKTFDNVLRPSEIALPDHPKTPATLGYYTGMREGEILDLKWDQVDLKEGKLILYSQQTKNKRPRLLYLDTELSKWLIMSNEIQYGAVAQLGERRVRNAKVAGSIPVRSTIFSMY
jgi:integrase